MPPRSQVQRWRLALELRKSICQDIATGHSGKSLTAVRHKTPFSTTASMIFWMFARKSRSVSTRCQPVIKRRQLQLEQLEDRCVFAASLVADINTNPSDSLPQNLVAVGSTLFFTATEPGKFTPPMLWKSDGTAAGTVKVKDIGGRIGAQVYFNDEVAMGNQLYFSASVDGVAALWKSDGTAAGTVPLKNIAASNLTVVGSTLYFMGTDANGPELWKSDGTAAGTVLVKDIQSGSSGSAPWFLTAVGNKLFFIADDGTSGKEVWKSDGTTTGTVRVADLNPGTGSSDPQSLTAVGNSLFFIANNSTSGYRLYKTDGTTTSTVGNIQFSNELTSTGRTLVAVGSNLFFNLNKSELWKTDGTAAGTGLVSVIPNTDAYITFTRFVAVGSTLYFTARSDDYGYELWRSDGTSAGTQMVKDMYPGRAPDLLDSPTELIRAGTLVYVLTNDKDVWVSDGTVAGTTLVKSFPVYSGTTDARPRYLTAAGSQVFLSADDATAGVELWRTDGTAAGTRVVKDIKTGTVGSKVVPVGVANGALLLNADEVVRDVFTNGRYPTLWKTDGSQAGTQLLFEQPIVSFDGFTGVATVGNNFYFRGRLNVVDHLFRTDGTSAGTQDIYTGLKASGAAVVGNRFFFNGNNDELWVSDGTTAGTKQVADIYPGDFPSTPYSIAPFGAGVIFVANDGVHGHELWKSDGTVAGTVLIKDINPGSNWSSIGDIKVTGGIAFFTAWDGTNTTRPALWRSDGTTSGTYRLADMDAKNLFVAGSTLYLAGAGGTTGFELWKSDGTIAGTQLVKNISQFSDSNPSNFVSLANQVYFTAQPSYGAPVEIWRTDGTSTETVRVSVGLWGSQVNTVPRNLVAVGSTIYFVASDGVTGAELWQTDGTSTGTKLAQDIWPGSEESDPQDLTVFRGELYFSAEDGVHGRELWKIKPALQANLPQNPNGKFDVDANGKTTIDDAVILIRSLRLQNVGMAVPSIGPPYLDVTGDHLLQVDDVVAVVRELRKQRAAAPSGEAEAMAGSTTPTTAKTEPVSLWEDWLDPSSQIKRKRA